MAKSKLVTILKRLGTGRPKPNTISPGLAKAKRYGKGGAIKTQARKKSS